jgi:transcriptional antiterminator RfaH
MQSTPFWCAARLMPRREALAIHCLGLAGFKVYLPRLRERRIMRGRRVEVRPPLFPGYVFVAIVLQWHRARWCPGVLSLIMAGDGPARVPDDVIAELRSRERDGLIELAKPPRF